VDLTSSQLAPRTTRAGVVRTAKSVSMSALVPLVARDVSKSYADTVVLDGVDLVATPGQPLGVVGENGVGKSTLLRLLAGVEDPDAGVVTHPDDLGYLAQNPSFGADATVADVLAEALAPLHNAVERLERLAAGVDDPVVADEYAETLEWAQHHGAWDADRRAALAATRLGLDAIAPDRPARRLSGGQRSRLALAALLARLPECVILDEPTNHLDDAAMDFVETLLRELPGVVVVATHDREFLERTCSAIIDLDESYYGVDGRGGDRFVGTYSAFIEQKRLAHARWERAFAEQRDELKELRQAAATTARQVAHNRPSRDNDKYAYHFHGENVAATVRRRVRDAEQRIAVIEREPIPKPPRQLAFDAPLGRSGNDDRVVVTARDLVVDGRLRLDRLDVPAGQHLLVAGANGSGKSTLLGVLNGDVQPTSGELRVAARRVRLLPQDVRFQQPDRTPQSIYEAMTDSPVALGRLGLLSPRDLSRPVGVLSMGAQRRLALAVVVASRPDLLLLDEPTNHISLALADELEAAIGRSPGTVVVASHDRWLRRRWDEATLLLG
jgi:macrolide transport system ATP-binding/permease protein